MASDEWPTTCRDCGADRAELDDGAPCKVCGSTLKVVHVTVSDIAAASDAVVELGIGYGPHRPWWEKWQEAVDALAELDNAYAGKLPGSDSNFYKRLMTHFCHACFAVKDWLKDDPRITVPDDVIEKYVNEAPALSVVRDVSNTDKHRTRYAGQRAARVHSVNITPRAVYISVDFEGAHAGPPMDAQDLAERAIAEWRSFFKAHGITEP